MGWIGTVLVAGVVAVGCAGCAGQDPGDDAGERPAEVAPSVIVPGGPGEPATVLPGDEALERQPAQAPSPQDVAFMQDMIVHHGQALEMVALVDGALVDQRVATLAERIAVTQGPEIDVMERWLARHDSEHGSEHGDEHGDEHGAGHGSDHAGMPGMATPAQLTELGEAQGPDADRLFLTMMIAHHEGALVMVRAMLATNIDVQVGQLADEIAVTQAAEIDRMREMLAS